MQPHGRQPTRLPHPWDSPGKNYGVGCHFLLQCMKVKSESEVAQSYPTLCDPMDCSLPGSSIHGIFQARVLEWGAIAFSEFTLYTLAITFLTAIINFVKMSFRTTSQFLLWLSSNVLDCVLLHKGMYQHLQFIEFIIKPCFPFQTNLSTLLSLFYSWYLHFPIDQNFKFNFVLPLSSVCCA